MGPPGNDAYGDAYRDTYRDANGVRLHTVTAGPEDGPLVILLHGFPEFWYGWRKQLPALAEAGYRVLVPDQRGYNLSDKPEGVQAYALEQLAGDVAGLIEASGRERALLVGHDWGAAVAWWLAMTCPERLEKLVVINVPHPQVMARAVRSNVRQLLKSWYILLFQLPRLPEALARRARWRLLRRALTRTSRSGTFGEADLARYSEAWSQPGAITAMLNWYRAALRHPARGEDERVRVPTLILWGAQDAFLARELAEESLERCERGELVVLEDAGHWVQHEEPERVNRLLLEFFEGVGEGVCREASPCRTAPPLRKDVYSVISSIACHRSTDRTPLISKGEPPMSLTRAITAGVLGAGTLTALHEAVRRIRPDAPRMDVLGTRALAGAARRLGFKPPPDSHLHDLALFGDVVSNGLFYSLVGLGRSENALHNGALLGLAAGVGGVLLPGPLGLGSAPSARAPATEGMTVGWYMAGGAEAVSPPLTCPADTPRR